MGAEFAMPQIRFSPLVLKLKSFKFVSNNRKTTVSLLKYIVLFSQILLGKVICLIIRRFNTMFHFFHFPLFEFEESQFQYKVGPTNPVPGYEQGVWDQENEMSGDEMSGDEMSVNEQSRNKGSGSKISGNEMSGDDMSGYKMSVNKQSVNQVSWNKMSENEMSGNEMSGNEMSGNKMSGNVMSADKVSGIKMSGNKM